MSHENVRREAGTRGWVYQTTNVIPTDSQIAESSGCGLLKLLSCRYFTQCRRP